MEFAEMFFLLSKAQGLITALPKGEGTDRVCLKL